jgi:hypothetical protein
MTAVFYAIHPREDLAHVVRLEADANGRALLRGATILAADCSEELGKDWQGWALVAERDFPLEDGRVVVVCNACKAAAPPAPAGRLEKDPPPPGALTERPAGPPRKASEIAEDLERIRDEVRSPRLRYFLGRAIDCLRGQSCSRPAGAP